VWWPPYQPVWNAVKPARSYSSTRKSCAARSALGGSAAT
jgi:hypothetical protein